MLERGRSGTVTLEGRPLEAGDVAVIVRRNKEALLVRDALRAKGVPAVIHSNESLFATAEAEALLRLLRGIADPASEGAVRAALSSPLFGLNWLELHSLFADEEQWEAWVEKFLDWLALWQEQGFIAMAGDLMRREKIRLRILGGRDGERQLTNLIHCLEILHHSAVKKHLGVKALVKWFAAQIEERPEKEEYQLRLETDRKAVTVITIHRSKGLGFPVVFCPYSWDGIGGGARSVFFHDPDLDYRYCLDLGSERLEEHKKMMEMEALGENMRLLYVALTRAKHRCYLAWGAFKGAQSSALAYLFHSRTAAGKNSLEGVFPEFSARTDPELLADIEKRAELSGGDILVSAPPDQAAGQVGQGLDLSAAFEAAAFTAKVEKGWEIASFTSLARSPASHDEERDKVEEISGGEPFPAAVPETEPAAAADFFSFPRGAKAGLCLHAILEKIDFQMADQRALKKMLREELVRYRFDDRLWTPVLSEMLDKVCSVPPEIQRFELLPGGGRSLPAADGNGVLLPHDRGYGGEPASLPYRWIFTGGKLHRPAAAFTAAPAGVS